MHTDRQPAANEHTASAELTATSYDDGLKIFQSNDRMGLMVYVGMFYENHDSITNELWTLLVFFFYYSVSTTLIHKRPEFRVEK